MIDLSNFSRSDLRILQERVADQIKSRQMDEVANVQQQILALARSVGMSVEQIMKVRGTEPKKPGAVRYRHPSQPDLQWSGRGRQPRWIKEYTASGKALESLLLAGPQESQ